MKPENLVHLVLAATMLKVDSKAFWKELSAAVDDSLRSAQEQRDSFDWE